MEIDTQSPETEAAADRGELSTKISELIAASRGLVPEIDPARLLQAKSWTPTERGYLQALENTARRLYAQTGDRAWQRTAKALRLLQHGGWKTK